MLAFWRTPFGEHRILDLCMDFIHNYKDVEIRATYQAMRLIGNCCVEGSGSNANRHRVLAETPFSILFSCLRSEEHAKGAMVVLYNLCQDGICDLGFRSVH